MKNLSVVDVRQKIKVQQNTYRHAPDFFEIFDKHTGERLHRGQPAYIRRVALKRYGHIVS